MTREKELIEKILTRKNRVKMSSLRELLNPVQVNVVEQLIEEVLGDEATPSQQARMERLIGEKGNHGTAYDKRDDERATRG